METFEPLQITTLPDDGIGYSGSSVHVSLSQSILPKSSFCREQPAGVDAEIAKLLARSSAFQPAKALGTLRDNDNGDSSSTILSVLPPPVKFKRQKKRTGTT